MNLYRTDWAIILAVLAVLAIVGMYSLATSKQIEYPQAYQLVSHTATLITVASAVGIAFCLWKIISYEPPEKPLTPRGLRPVQVPPAYILYAARRSGRRPEEFMARGE